MASIAQKVIKHNKLANKIKVVQKRSTELTVEEGKKY